MECSPFSIAHSPLRPFATESNALIGTWKLVSWQVIVDHEAPQNVFGPNQKGYLVLAREGRSTVALKSWISLGKRASTI